jgi:hypothetical protein
MIVFCLLQDLPGWADRDISDLLFNDPMLTPEGSPSTSPPHWSDDLYTNKVLQDLNLGLENAAFLDKFDMDHHCEDLWASEDFNHQSNSKTAANSKPVNTTSEDFGGLAPCYFKTEVEDALLTPDEDGFMETPFDFNQTNKQAEQQQQQQQQQQQRKPGKYHNIQNQFSEVGLWVMCYFLPKY